MIDDRDSGILEPYSYLISLISSTSVTTSVSCLEST